MPLAPARPRSWRGAILAGGVVVALLVAFAGFFVVRARLSTPPQDASGLLRQAGQANLRDATYTISGGLTANVAGVGSLSTPLSGSGAIIRAPYQQHLLVQVTAPAGLGAGAITEEAIIIGDVAYVRTLSSGSTSNATWTKTTTAGISTIPGLNAVNLLDYSILQHPVIVGEDTINGHKAWHVRGDLTAQSGSAATATAGQVQSQGTEDLWLREDNKFPAQTTLHLTVTANARDAGLSGTLDLTETSTFTRWNTGVVITPPTQVQG
jgi:hypothetical protein